MYSFWFIYVIECCQIYCICISILYIYLIVERFLDDSTLYANCRCILSTSMNNQILQKKIRNWKKYRKIRSYTHKWGDTGIQVDGITTGTFVVHSFILHVLWLQSVCAFKRASNLLLNSSEHNEIDLITLCGLLHEMNVFHVHICTSFSFRSFVFRHRLSIKCPKTEQQKNESEYLVVHFEQDE